MPSNTTLIFDFDGTLADSFELVLEVAYEMTGVRRRTPQEITDLRRLPLLTAIHRLGVPWWRVPYLLLLFRRRMYSRMQDVRIFPGVAPLIATLHEQGYHLLVMSSNRERNVRACLRAHNLERYFDGIYHSNVFNKARGLRRIVRRNKITPQSAYYIGNEVLDIMAAHRVGMRAVAVRWSGQDANELQAAQPQALVDTPRDIQQLFEQGGV